MLQDYPVFPLLPLTSRQKLLLGTLTVMWGMQVTHVAQAAWWWPFGSKNLVYDIKIKGVDKKTRAWMTELNLDKPTTSNPPQKKEELKQEAVTLNQRLRKAMEAKGYYDAVIAQQVKLESDPPVLQYQITPGKRYHVRAVQFEWPGKPVKNLSKTDLSIQAGDGVDAELIQKDALQIVRNLDKDTCFLKLDVTPVLQLEGRTHKAILSYRITHGPQANFGQPVIKGQVRVKDKVILRSVSWKQGECFKQSKIDSTQTKLVQSQLMSSVTVVPAEAPNAQGEVPVTITIKERVARTLTAGLQYTTDKGFGVNTGWEHRNLWGGAEKLNVDLALAQQEQSILSKLRIPAFLHNSQTLALNAGFKRQDTDAYVTDSITTGATLERRLMPNLNGGVGVAYTLTQTEDVLGGNSKYGLLSFPSFLDYDTRDDAMDTRKGMLGNLNVTPYTETFGDGGQFVKTQLNLQTYFSSDVTLKPTLALKLTLGSILGADGTDVPSDLRYYAGGGGSVRGYSYQSLSPRVNGKEVGGSSMMAASTEVRVRFTETIGAVAFVDAGNAYEDMMPQIGKDLYYGAGVGARYYSPVGPLRVDVAVPLNGKDIGETGYGLYVSLGQAF
jgi:translocation and assembly module TamA